MLLTEHAVLEGKGASGHHLTEQISQISQISLAISGVLFLLDLLHNTYSTHLAMNHLFFGPLCLSLHC